MLRYQKRISGPLLDHIDIQITVPRVDYEKLSGGRLGEKSEAIRKRVERARERQRKRFAPCGNPRLQVNADMGPAEVRQRLTCQLDEGSRTLVRAAMPTHHHARCVSSGGRDDASQADEPERPGVSSDIEAGADDR